MKSAGKFITFEGLDGAGKSSQIDTAEALIKGQGKTVVRTREPGGTPLAEKIRELVLAESMDLATETLLLFAARQHHLCHIILPALTAGNWVVCDRFTDASYAYQGGGRGVPKKKIEMLEQWVQEGFCPDLTLLFDLPFEVARQRIGAERTLDRFEKERADFHERVRNAYLERADQSSGRIVIIDATQSHQNVEAQVIKAVSTHCL